MATQQKRKILSAFLLVFITLTTHAQYSVHGKITDERGQSITPATCSLLSEKDSSIIKISLSDKDGRYELVSTEIGNALLKTEATGYITTIQFFNFTGKDIVIDVKLHAEKKLKGVTVTARKSLIEQKRDRTIFNVEQSITAIGGNALDALKKTPSVLVINNQVTIAGKGSVSIMLNGRLQQISGEDLTQLLRSIPSDNLSKIEVITTPPARYDAEGNSGIINLVTKKNLQQGLKGSVTGSYNRNTYNSASLSNSLNYRKGKLNLFTNISLDKEAYKYTNIGSTYYPEQSWDQEVNQGYFINSGRAQAGGEYALNKQSVLGVTYTFNTATTKMDEFISASVYNPQHQLDSNVFTTGHSNEPFNQKHTLNMTYEWKIDTTGKKLNVDADYYTQSSRKAREFYIGHYLADGTATGFTSNNRTSANPSLTIKSIKADVDWPLTFANLSFGVKAAFVNSVIGNVYETQGNTEYIVDTTQTNTFNYTEQTQAAYISAQKSINDKWEYQLGLRAEHTHTKGYSPTTNSVNENDYTQLFPSGFLQYKPDENHAISLSYTRRINRPGYNLLNPFRFYYSLNSYFVGNPTLQPAYNNILRLSWVIKSKYTFVAFANYTNNYWDRISNVDPVAGNVGFTRANIGRAWHYGVSASISVNPTKWWEFHGSINGQYSDFKLVYYDNTSYSGITGLIDGGSSFTLNKKKTLSAEINAYYHAPRQKDYKQWDEMSAVYIGFKALLLDKNLIIAVNADDIFKNAFWYQTNKVNGTTEYSYDDECSVRIAVTYKFGNKNIKARREQSASEELQRAN